MAGGPTSEPAILMDRWGLSTGPARLEPDRERGQGGSTKGRDGKHSRTSPAAPAAARRGGRPTRLRRFLTRVVQHLDPQPFDPTPGGIDHGDTSIVDQQFLANRGHVAQLVED